MNCKQNIFLIVFPTLSNVLDFRYMNTQDNSVFSSFHKMDEKLECSEECLEFILKDFFRFFVLWIFLIQNHVVIGHIGIVSPECRGSLRKTIRIRRIKKNVQANIKEIYTKKEPLHASLDVALIRQENLEKEVLDTTDKVVSTSSAPRRRSSLFTPTWTWVKSIFLRLSEVSSWWMRRKWLLLEAYRGYSWSGREDGG